MLLLSLQALIKPSKNKHFRNVIALCVLLTPMHSLANDHFSSWSDKTICRLAKATPDNTEYQAESTKRGLDCGVAVTSSYTATTTSTKIKVSLSSAVQLSTSSGNWFPADGPMYSPHYATHQGSPLRDKSYWSNHFAFADFDDDGIEDFFTITNPYQSGFDYTSPGPNCLTDLGDCYSNQGSISLVKVEKPKYSSRFNGLDVSGLLIDTNPIEMKGTDSTDLHVADFNGDGKVDIFASENNNINGKFGGKNDMYFLSNAEGLGWTESTATHITGTGVRKGKGLTNFSHGATIGDIDGDGDIDIVVMSINWVGNNGEILCYVNQGDGHMKVRRCGKQWGFTVELGDIDNDGDLDIVFGSDTHSAAKFWNTLNQIPGCTGSRCNGAFNGILLNNGKGNFNRRGFSFPDNVKNSSGFSYSIVPAIGLADLDGDDDLDVLRMHVGRLYAGAGITIEENIGNGKFKTVFYSEFCKSPKTKAEFPRQEGSDWNCWAADFKFGDFNKDGLVDIYIEGHDANKSDVVKDGAIYMNTGKFTYDIVLPNDKDYPLHEIRIK